ncbi:Endoplasmic reticulum resident protein 29 [Dermatophagoides pteronyssinus]|uniref:Endoplasmic reticulum resident protein 29 n=1 Tax=Dermatophagoides pteronyssinus TaxID=6956 RepID=A0ABQ8IWP7_DERPT|nr:Endoplasmic reticulum resident protein 29 [Dermatophagoides pteronyssinus]
MKNQLSLLGYIFIDILWLTKHSFVLITVVNNFKAVIVKFDESYSVDPEKDAVFKTLAEELRSSMDIFVGHLVIPYPGNDGELAEEEKLAKQYNITSHEDMPVIFLYRQNNFENQIRFNEKKFDSYSLRDFIRTNVPGLSLQLDSYIPELENLVKDFITDKSPEKRKKILKETEKQVNGMNDNKKESAKIYVKIMKRILERGDIFIESEFERIRNLMNRKLSQTKKNILKSHLNIVYAFRSLNTMNIRKDEL